VLSFEEYKKICGPEVLKLPEKDLLRIYEGLTTLADLCFRSWVKERRRKRSRVNRRRSQTTSLLSFKRCFGNYWE